MINILCLFIHQKQNVHKMRKHEGVQHIREEEDADMAVSFKDLKVFSALSSLCSDKAPRPDGFYL